MDLTPYVDNLRQELAIAANAGGDEARALAERLTAPLESAARLTLLNALSAAMGEVTRELAPGSVDVRLRGLDPEFVVTAAPALELFYEPRASPPDALSTTPSATPSASAAAFAPSAVTPSASSAAAPEPASPPADADDGAMARINFRLPAHLKGRAESAAAAEGLSVNAWLVRAVSTALDDGERTNAPNRGRGTGTGSTGSVGTGTSSGGRGFTGWVR
ncbi:hypothetical protein [Streptomyces paludis]|uniref:Toxin-antitoxin system HicB family antitoxin n=1 Tax=Streptomyces paludis TaxID=2282738 RepID=A0A345HS32_9ACTN|nr:hypothetical protein [Streptomyces paludis]AXG79506.1 hypothetical protein DVK44_19700 [Streptomyces paludis]